MARGRRSAWARQSPRLHREKQHRALEQSREAAARSAEQRVARPRMRPRQGKGQRLGAVESKPCRSRVRSSVSGCAGPLCPGDGGPAMKVVIQCAARKRPAAKPFLAMDGRRVAFVAHPDLAPRDESAFHARPDDLSEDGRSWRKRLLAYNEDAKANPLGFLPAYRLYSAIPGRLMRRWPLGVTGGQERAGSAQRNPPLAEP